MFHLSSEPARPGRHTVACSLLFTLNASAMAAQLRVVIALSLLLPIAVASAELQPQSPQARAAGGQLNIIPVSYAARARLLKPQARRIASLSQAGSAGNSRDNSARSPLISLRQNDDGQGYAVGNIAFLGSEESEGIRVISTELGSWRLVNLGQMQSSVSWSVEAELRRVVKIARRIMLDHGFPDRLLEADYRWQLFFYKQKMKQRGAFSSRHCHAAQIGPPANIFLAIDALRSDCGKRRLSNSELKLEFSRTLIHELGHAIEFQLMGRGFSRRKRWHSEGFATLFETLSTEVFPASHPENLRAKARALLRPGWRPVLFQGNASDYLRSFALISAIADGKDDSELFAVYRRMDQENLSFEEAVEAELGLNKQKLVAESLHFFERSGYADRKSKS